MFSEKKASSGSSLLMRMMMEYMRRDGDSDLLVQQKAIYILFVAASAVFLLIAGAVALSYLVCCLLVCMVGLYALWVREVSVRFLCVVSVLGAAVVTYADMLSASVWMRNWPIFVIYVDILLVMDAPRYITVTLVCYVLVWIFVVELEYNYRWMGLFDLPDSPSYALRQKLCDCERPPCAMHMPVYAFMARLGGPYIIFVVDWLLTRGFANQVLVEKQRMATAVRAAESVTQCLAHFDLDTGLARLQSAEDNMPKDLYASLQRLLDNMESYRPFLPGALFVEGNPVSRRGAARSSVESEPSERSTPSPMPSPHRSDAPLHLSSAWSRPPFYPSSTDTVPEPALIPGLVTKEAAFAAVSVWQASVLWELSNTAMQRALGYFDNSLRLAIAAKQGHIVRSTGDAFLVAFSGSEAAVRFAFDAQMRLQDVPWPADLGATQAFSARIGVHSGKVDLEQNVFNGDYDYFGDTPRLAWRMGASGAPLGVSVSGQALQDLEGGELMTEVIVVECTQVVASEHVDGADITFSVLLPKALEHQRDVVVEHMHSAREDPEDRKTQSPKSKPSASPSVAALQPSAPGQRSASVGVVKLGAWNGIDEPSGESMGAELEVLYQAMKDTGGVLTTVVSRCVVVSWNAHAATRQHLASSMQFVVKLFEAPRDRGPHWGCPFHAGLATGPVPATVLTPSSDLSLITLVGPCVDLAWVLCSAAVELGTCVLVAAAGNDVADRHKAHPFLSPYLRPVDRWMFGKNVLTDRVVMVLELWVEGLISQAAGRGAWSGDYFKAFVLKDVSMLRTLGGDDDHVVEHICRMIEAGEHFPHALMCVTHEPVTEESSEKTAWASEVQT